MARNKTTTKASETSGGAGKTYALQKGAVETAPEADVDSQKAKLVEAFDEFLDAIADRVGIDPEPDVDCDGPAEPGGGEAPSGGTAQPGGGGAPSGGSAQPGGGEVSSGGPARPGGVEIPGDGCAPAGDVGGPSGAAALGASKGGSETVSGGTLQTEAAIREAFERQKPILREAFRNDQLRDTLVNARRAERAARRVAETGGGAENAHQSDSNVAPVVEERSFAPNFGSEGAGAAAGITREKFSTSASAKPVTVPEAGVVNLGPPLDAWFGSNGSARERAEARFCAIIGPQTESSRLLEVIQGSDDRVRVGNTTAYPWRCIASLLITASTGAQYVGTGWLVGPRLLLTAGHCVYMADEGGWVRQIEVIPGRDATNRPYGSAVATAFRSVTGWTRDENSEYDYAAILLPEDKRFGDQLGWFGYSASSDEHLNNLTVNLSGYPGDGGKTGVQGTQWFHSRALTGNTARQVTYDIDTVGGQSGAPVWELQQNGGRYGVAIHTYGTSSHNGGTRITREVFDNIVRWAGEVP
jgi:glutamyl endopeptidase